jgi:mRNA interferase HigB
MRVISRRALREFWESHSAAKEPLAAWFRLMETSDFGDFNQVRKTFGAADYLAPFTIFDVGGNKFRVIAVIHYNRQCAYVRHVFTHSEYDHWSETMRKTKRGKR